jgi:hypothetical protein
MKLEISFFGSAAAMWKSSRTAIGLEFCFAAMGLNFRALVLRDDRCGIP